MNWNGCEFGPFILGTAQLGMPYGIANTTGVPGSRDTHEILARADGAGIRCFDTAQAYGNSETVIGEFVARVPDSRRLVITKFGADAFASKNALEAALRLSAHRLKTVNIAMLSHSADLLSQPERTAMLFAHAKSTGLARFTGISVYTTAEALAGLELQNCDIIQIALNVLDRRPIESGLLDAARKANKLLLFRSVYLQGLLVIDPATLPDSVRFAAPVLNRWTDFCASHHVSPQAAALMIAARLAGEFPLVIGSELPAQIEENLRVLKQAPRSAFTSDLVAGSAELAALAGERLLNPSKWKH